MRATKLETNCEARYSGSHAVLTFVPNRCQNVLFFCASPLAGLVAPFAPRLFFGQQILFAFLHSVFPQRAIAREGSHCATLHMMMAMVETPIVAITATHANVESVHGSQCSAAFTWWVGLNTDGPKSQMPVKQRHKNNKKQRRPPHQNRFRWRRSGSTNGTAVHCRCSL